MRQTGDYSGRRDHRFGTPSPVPSALTLRNNNEEIEKMQYVSRKQRQTFESYKDTVFLVDQDWTRRHKLIAEVLELPKLRWVRAAGACYARGGLFVRRHETEPLLAWIASRNDVPLVAADGRLAVFRRRADAQVAALVHARDGSKDWSPIRDKLQWQETAALACAA
jgi:hypothetical protein